MTAGTNQNENNDDEVDYGFDGGGNNGLVSGPDEGGNAFISRIQV
jgi:hypothetical protein